MFQIKYINDDIVSTSDQRVNGLKTFYDDSLSNNKALFLYNISLDLSVNDTSTLTFTIPKSNSAYSKISRFITKIVVLRNNKVIFVGRAINESIDITGNRTLSCEDSYAFLYDSYGVLLLPKEEYKSTSFRYFFNKLVIDHNATNATSYINQYDDATYAIMHGLNTKINVSYRSRQSYDWLKSDKYYQYATDKSWREMLNSIVDDYNLYTWMTYDEKCNLYLNVTPSMTEYINSISDKNNLQKFKVGYNITSYSKSIQTENAIGLLRPIGNSFITTDDVEQDLSLDYYWIHGQLTEEEEKQLVELNGKIYISGTTQKELKLIGPIVKTVKYDITLDENHLGSSEYRRVAHELLYSGLADLANSSYDQFEYQISAIDMGYKDPNLKILDLMDLVEVEIDGKVEILPITGISIPDLSKPWSNGITISTTKYKKFTEMKG